ncbi:DUF4169 family protein [Novosphingobium sp. JCM 18896]|uniref:DUF4169 family protein n=1 Tax=Novosphingobium sp. JCM 18896 TaxID=2989731 RepID=UPI00222274AC|nr:DUF4169 family protein [Novosphingobium sp. JCM 18896]MCW1431458.1 DUF4169 family protein [Novosphingobium sp. JCM 18896]
MAEIINLRQARKAKQRDAAANQAAANRSLHGETKGEKLRRKQEADRLVRTVDGARLGDDGKDD